MDHSRAVYTPAPKEKPERISCAGLFSCIDTSKDKVTLASKSSGAFNYQLLGYTTNKMGYMAFILHHPVAHSKKYAKTISAFKSSNAIFITHIPYTINHLTK